MKEKVFVIDGSVGVTGALKSSLLIAAALEDVYEVSFVLPRGTKAGSKILSSGYTFYELPLFSLSKRLSSILLYFPMLFFCSFKLLKVFKDKNVSVLILNDFDKPLGFFLKLFRWKGRVYTFVRRRPSSFNKWLSFFWIRAAILTSNKVVAVSDTVLNELPKSKKIIRIYNSVGFSEIDYDFVYPSFDIVNFLCLGNYMPGKGQQEALESFFIAYQKNKNIRLHFAGGDLGLEKNRFFKESLIRRAKDLELDHVVFFEGYVDDVKTVICKSHIILNLSISESFSRVCIEAASFGRPVIATMSGGPQEIITHAKSGFLVEVGDISSVAKYIEWFAKNSGEILIMGAVAHRIVKEKFSFTKYKFEINGLISK